MKTYMTFLRSATSWGEFARARWITESIGLSYAEARRQCALFNEHRTARQIKRGTKLEFTAE